MKLISCFCFLMFVSFSIKAQVADTASQQFSLQQCIDIALKNNADVQHRQVTAETNKAYWQEAKANMLPTLNGDISHGINNGRSIDPYTNAYANQNINFADYSLTTSVTLFNAFAISNSIKQNKFAFNAAESETQQTKDAIALQVILEYLQLLTNADLAQVYTQQKEVSAKQVERLNILNQDGAISPSELYDLKGQYANDELQLIDALNNVETAKVQLTQLLNIQYNKNMQFQHLSLNDIGEQNSVNTDSIYQTALQNLAIIKAADLRKQSALYAVRSYRSQRYPSLFFSGGLYTNYSSNATLQHFLNTSDVTTGNYVVVDGSKVPLVMQQDNYSSSKIAYGSQFRNNFNSSFSIGIHIPLLNNFQNKTQIKTALLQQKDADITYNNLRNQLQQNIAQAYVNRNAARNRYDVLTEQVNAYNESFREAEVKFNAGTITSVDYLIAKKNVDAANINLVIARYDYVLRSMILDYYSGKLKF